MADTIKLPVIGPTKKGWVYAGGALIAGIVGYAYWARLRSEPATDELLPEDIPQGREPPATVVGTQNFTDEATAAIINTNAEWYTAAVDYLVSTGGFDFTFTTITLGKFLARRELTDQESNLVQAAKGAVGEPPQGGPWPIIRAGAAGPSTPTSTKLARPALTYWQGKTNNTNYGLAWNKIPGAAYYLLQRRSGPGSPTSIAVIGLSRRTPPLKRGASYVYRVRAQSVTPGVSSSDWSNEVHFQVPRARAA